MQKKIILSLPLLLVVILLLSSCVTVKEYQKNRLNDYDMALRSRKSQKTELNFQTYREGSAGANGGKTGGGCGCN
jgi:NADH:ubiquinone oxidoreductase subunit 3 (subunit A)